MYTASLTRSGRIKQNLFAENYCPRTEFPPERNKFFFIISDRFDRWPKAALVTDVVAEIIASMFIHRHLAIGDSNIINIPTCMAAWIRKARRYHGSGKPYLLPLCVISTRLQAPDY